MVDSADVDFSYRKARIVDREDWFGHVATWVGEHPLLGGLIGGLVVVAIAMAAVPGAVGSAPAEVAVLSALVVGVWAVLFYLMRNFFERMGETEIEEAYRFEADEEGFLWRRGDQVLVDIDEPSYELYAAEAIDDETKGDAAVSVYLAVRGEDEAFRLETKVTADEAAAYPVWEGEAEVDEELPVQMASSLLQRGRAAEEKTEG